MMNLIVNPEFQNKIPPLTDEEFKQLEELILADGKVKSPICVWNRIIVDGHHRWKIIQKHPELPFEVEEMHFEDKWEAFDWMYKNQLGRRNLTDEQRTFLLGKLYEARKHTEKFKGNQYVNESGGRQNGAEQKGRVREQIMKEQNVGQKTVERAEYYAHGIDAIREVDPGVADSILNGEKKIAKQIIQNVGKAKPEERKELAETILTGKTATKPASSRKGTGNTRENREFKKELDNIIAAMTDETPMEYTIDNLTEQIGFNTDTFIGVVSNLIMDHKDICDENRPEVIESLNDIITKIEKIKERLNDGTQL